MTTSNCRHVTAQSLSPSIPILERVIEMEKILPQKKGSLATRILEAFGITRACVQSVGTQEEAVYVNPPLDYTDPKYIEAAVLEAEQQKAKGLMQMQRQQFI